VKSGDVQRVKQAYSGLTDNQRKSWEALFRVAKPEEAEIRDFRGVSGPDAAGITVVNFVMAVRLSDRTNGTPVHSRHRYQARLKREGPMLVLQSLADLPPR
jgi:hypothetical protein